MANVDKDQTCGVPGRFIGENVAYLRDIVDYASLTGVLCAILALLSLVGSTFFIEARRVL